MRYTMKRDYCWSAELAYAVGLLASDGCLSSDGRHIDLTSVDYVQLENFSKAIGRELKITKKVNQWTVTAYRVQFSDVSLYDFLCRAGLSPKKSLVIKQILVPDEFYFDYFRGLFDGDGSVYAYFDPRWKSSYMYYLAITSASKEFLENIAIENRRLAEVGGASIRRSARAFSLVYGKSDTYKLYKLMYLNENKLFLPRKKKKLEGFLEVNQAAIITRQLNKVGQVA